MSTSCTTPHLPTQLEQIKSERTEAMKQFNGLTVQVGPDHAAHSSNHYLNTMKIMRVGTIIHPQYNDGSNLSRELHATVKLIDAIVEYQESIVMPPEYTPACIQKSLHWCNSRTSLIMDAMDHEVVR